MAASVDQLSFNAIIEEISRNFATIRDVFALLGKIHCYCFMVLLAVAEFGKCTFVIFSQVILHTQTCMLERQGRN